MTSRMLAMPTSPLLGISLFVTSSAVVTWYTTSKLSRHSTSSASSSSNTTSTSNNLTPDQSLTYEQLLTRLFNFSTPRTRPRTHEELSLEFLERQSYFNKHLQSLLDSHSCSAPKVVHVTGTKGKGSTCELVAAAIRGSGLRVGVFSSPHLHTACERIKIDSTLINREDFSRLAVWAMKCMSTEKWAVFFDVLLLMSLRYFVEKKVDYVVMEVGIGGRFDSTNFVNDPVASVITSVSLDHQSMLGNTVAEIAWQKAGIIKESGQVFVPGTLHPDALAVVQQECDLKRASLHIVDMSSDVNISMSATGKEISKYSVEQENVCVSAAVCRHLHVPLQGMQTYYWPCRMETFDLGAATAAGEQRSHEPIIVLDGCHNTLSVDLCVRGLRDRYPAKQGYDLWVAFGSGKDKNLDAMLEAVMQSADGMIATVSKHFRALDAQAMVDHVQPRYRLKLLHPSETAISAMAAAEGAALKSGNVAARLTWAINQARKRSQQASVGKHVVIVVCGSLFVAAEAREFLFNAFPLQFSPNDWVRFKDEEIPMAAVPTPGSGRQKVRKKSHTAHAKSGY
mmetsp:Transcript_22849/g.42653  ORF Transcript_22849/g.42653 Transcript_22849/m.42653 type:complete len:566 (-) Transcript_22849:276-1973(-)